MSHPSAKEKWLARLDDALRDGTFVKLTLSGHRGKDEALRNVFGRRIDLRGEPHLSFVYRYATRDVTKNLPLDEVREFLADLGSQFRHAHLFTTQRTLELDCREGRTPRLIESKPVHDVPPSADHDQAKPRPIATDTRWLRALGVTTTEGKVAKGMEAKFRQINKFVEILDPLLPVNARSRSGEVPTRALECGDLSPLCTGDLSPSDAAEHGPLADNQALADQSASTKSGDKSPHSKTTSAATFTVVDMGCGKGYLTFAVYDWLRRNGSGETMVRGIEARPELVELCNRVARENQCDGLSFEVGSIATTKLEPMDALIALHACDTATDDAIAQGIEAGASLIIVSPCCHKEVRTQLTSPPVLAGALRHGILLERHAEFVTDALRAALLEWAGYDTRVFEFISTEHTAKNLMITATKRPSAADRDEAAARVRELAAFYGIRSQQLATSLDFSLASRS